MNAREEIEKLKKEFVSLNTEKERVKFDVKFRNYIDSKSESEKEEFADAFIESANDAVLHAKKFCRSVTKQMQLEDALK